VSNEYGERDEKAAVFDTQPHAEAGHVESNPAAIRAKAASCVSMMFTAAPEAPPLLEGVIAKNSRAWCDLKELPTGAGQLRGPGPQRQARNAPNRFQQVPHRPGNMAGDTI
jgi:hypothetical protein